MAVRVLIEAMEFATGCTCTGCWLWLWTDRFTAAKLASDGHVTMIDINERAVELAKENAKAKWNSNVSVTAK